MKLFAGQKLEIQIPQDNAGTGMNYMSKPDEKKN